MKFNTLPITGIVLLTASAFSLATPTAAEAKQWDMCAWEEIPSTVVKRIVRRADYSEILQRMEDNCPDAAYALLNHSADKGSDFVTRRVNTPEEDSDETVTDPGRVGDADPDTVANTTSTNDTADNGGGASDGGGSSDGDSSSDSGGSSDGGGAADGGATSDGGGSADSGAASDGDSTSNGGGRGSSANNGGGNGSEGGSPGKGRGANNDER